MSSPIQGRNQLQSLSAIPENKKISIFLKNENFQNKIVYNGAVKALQSK
jgi:hypothetical protein